MNKNTSSINAKLKKSFIIQFPQESAKIINNFSYKEIAKILDGGSVEFVNEVFKYLDPETAAILLNEMDSLFFIKLYSVIDPGQGAKILARLDKEEIEEKFGFLVDALAYGAPPHGGLAFGFDRLMMIFAGEQSIRDVIAFPKTQKAACLLTSAPGRIDRKQLLELGLKVEAGDRKKE